MEPVVTDSGVIKLLAGVLKLGMPSFPAPQMDCCECLSI